MKKFFSFILLLVYFMVSTGFVVNMHFCMDRLDSVQIGDHGDDECSKCGMPATEKKGCCRDEVKVVKLQQDVTPASALAFSFFSLTAALPVQVFELFILRADQFMVHHSAHAPPLLSGQYTYLLNCVFRL